MVASTHHAGLERRASSASRPSEMYKFPELSEDALELEKEYGYPESRLSSPGPLPNFANLHSTERWQARKDAAMNGGVGAGVWSQGGSYSGATRHGRQKSLSEAIRTVRTRKGSVTQNAHEIAEALKAPVSAQLVVRIRKGPRMREEWQTDGHLRSSVASGTRLRSSPTPPPRPS